MTLPKSQYRGNTFTVLDGAKDQPEIGTAFDVTASILYPSITIRLRRLPDTFWHLVRSIVRASRIFFVAAKIVSSARKFGEKNWGRCDRFRPKIVEIGAILAIFEPFEKLKNSLATFGRIQPIVPGFVALYPP